MAAVVRGRRHGRSCGCFHLPPFSGLLSCGLVRRGDATLNRGGGKRFSGVKMGSLVSCFPSSNQTSHELPFLCGHSDIFCGCLRCKWAATASLGAGLAPGRTKSALVGAPQNYIRSRRASPGKTKGAHGAGDGVRKDQRRVGGAHIRTLVPYDSIKY